MLRLLFDRYCPNYGPSSHRSQVPSPYKLFINNHSVTIDQNPILFNFSQEFTRNFGIWQPSSILNAKHKKIFKQNVWQLAPVWPIFFFFFSICDFTVSIPHIIFIILSNKERGYSYLWMKAIIFQHVETIWIHFCTLIKKN